ncbi:hypothetical protein MBCUR_17330 [Methanobrevibacter curvatus]|uniref:Uncharacterized protein n=1 Tax=Methanobrevibacter curvatus TaxID=49547 RepID=A0A165ZEF5_9EURY|nr:hypothetical protein MBCUR_17330 [Methanobrevibacter curvatus]
MNSTTTNGFHINTSTISRCRVINKNRIGHIKSTHRIYSTTTASTIISEIRTTNNQISTHIIIDSTSILTSSVISEIRITNTQITTTIMNSTTIIIIRHIGITIYKCNIGYCNVIRNNIKYSI